jgi:acyl-CoA synthetase (AMP-forming)/AMP-acid ligase II
MLTVYDRYDAREVAGFYADGLWRRTSLYGEVVVQAEQRPDKGCVSDSTSSLTFVELREQALRIAVGLHRLGVRRGDRVVVQLPNWTELIALIVAISRIGAVLVPVLPIYRRAEVEYVVRHSEAVVALAPVEFRRFEHVVMFRELSGTQLRQVVAVRAEGDQPEGVPSLDDLAAEGSLADLEAEVAGLDADPDDPFLIMYTSGTTSFPKGCLHTLNTIRSSALMMGDSFEYTEDDVQFGPSPVAHASGMVHSFLLPLVHGASSHLMEIWDPAEALRRIDERRITTAAGATAFLEMMLEAHRSGAHDLSTLRYWACAGSPIPAAVIERAAPVFPGTRWLSVYGRSENLLTTMCRLSDPPERAATSDGAAPAGARVEVVGPDGMELPRGEEGDIGYAGPSHMLGYFKDPAQTAALFTRSGLSLSGDLGRMGPDGFVRVTGRMKDIVVRGGMNISAQELEGHLAGHPQVRAVAVVAMPDQRLGEKVCVYVVPKGEAPVTLETINDHLRRQHVATQKLPERLEVVAELPMTPTGKVQKHLLRADVRAKLETP